MAYHYLKKNKSNEYHDHVEIKIKIQTQQKANNINNKRANK